MSIQILEFDAIRNTHPTVTSTVGQQLFDTNGNTVDRNQSLIDAEVVRLQNAEPIKLLRAERNAKLAETDWVVTMHKELGTNIPSAMKTYRAALRDITDSATSLDDVTWPEKP